MQSRADPAALQWDMAELGQCHRDPSSFRGDHLLPCPLQLLGSCWQLLCAQFCIPFQPLNIPGLLLSPHSAKEKCYFYITAKSCKCHRGGTNDTAQGQVMARAVEDQTGLHPWPLLEEKDEKRGNSWCGRAPGEDSSLSPPVCQYSSWELAPGPGSSTCTGAALLICCPWHFLKILQFWFQV